MAHRRLGAVAAAALVLGCTTACASPAPAPGPSPSAPARPAFPAVPGPRAGAYFADDVWHVRVRVVDPEAAYADARRRLVDGGYQLTKDREATGGGDGQACTQRLCVGFTATPAPDGPAVAYEVFHPLGITTG